MNTWIYYYIAILLKSVYVSIPLLIKYNTVRLNININIDSFYWNNEKLLDSYFQMSIMDIKFT